MEIFGIPLFFKRVRTAQEARERWKGLFDWLQSIIRIFFVGAILLRFAFHFPALSTYTIGRSVLTIISISVFAYTVLSQVLSSKLRADNSVCRQEHATALIVADWCMFQIALACTFNVQSDVHLAFFIPLMTAISHLEMRRVRDLAGFILIFFIPTLIIVPFAVHILYKFDSQADCFLSLLGVIPESIAKSVFTVILPRCAAWGVIGTPILLHLTSSRQLETELRLALKKASAVAEFFQTLSDELPYPVFLKDCDRRFLWVDKRLAEEIAPKPDGTRWTPEEMVGKTDFDIFGDAPNVAAYQESDIRALTGPSTRVDIYEPHFNSALAGSSTILTTKVRISDRKGNLIGVLGICRDANADDDATLFKEAMSGSQHCVFRKNLKGQFVYVNAEFALTTGKERRDIHGKTDEELYGLVGRKYRLDDLRLIREKSHRVRRYKEQHPFRLLGNELRWVEVRKMALFDSHGKPYGIQGVFWDVQAGADENERFINVFLHDAPKPLMLIEDNYTQPLLDFAEDILNADGDFEKPLISRTEVNDLAVLVEQQVEMIRNAAQFVLSQFTCFGMLSASWLKREYQESDKDFQIQAIIEPLALHLRLNGGCYRIRTDYSGLQGHVFRGKASALKCVFWILVDNAIKASFRGQKAREAAWLRENPNRSRLDLPFMEIKGKEPKASFRYADGMLHFEVEDDGDGLSLEMQEELNRVIAAEARTARFGWIIVTYLAEQLRGMREINSAGEGRGATARFAMPIEQREKPEQMEKHDTIL